jgi:phosphotransferase system HPr-like phosphotransfer protein
MQLLARYVRASAPSTLDMHLLDIETQDLIHLVTDAEAEQENEALTTLAHAWAKQNGHTIAAIDPHILNQS